MPTDDQIQDAIRNIIKSGKIPTVRAVHEVVGGSFTTIQPLLAAWFKERGEGKAGIVLAAYNALDSVDRETFQRLAGLRKDTRLRASSKKKRRKER